ncbi:MAG: hypothetical protein OXG81_13610 [Acidobacteria bacterium]|nr:hypothetical protein [Acidobacteriota bacterium]
MTAIPATDLLYGRQKGKLPSTRRAAAPRGRLVQVPMTVRDAFFRCCSASGAVPTHARHPGQRGHLCFGTCPSVASDGSLRTNSKR